MAITDRKLFKNPRPARDKLNNMGGIMASSAPLMDEVQRFQQGGSVIGFGNPFGGTVITDATGQRYMAPSYAESPGQAGNIDILRRAAEQGIGSLSIPERAYIAGQTGGQAGLDATQGIRDYLGGGILSDIIGGGSSLAGSLIGFGGSLANELLIDEEGDQSSLGGRLSSMVPSSELLESQGFVPIKDAVSTPSSSPPPPPPPTAGAPRGIFQGPPQAVSVDMSDPAVRKRLEDERRARAITDAGGIVDVDEVTGEVTPGPSDEIQQLIDAAQQQQRTLESENRRQLDQLGPRPDDSDIIAGSRYDDGTPGGTLADDGVGGIVEDEAAPSVTPPEPRPDNLQELIAASKKQEAILEDEDRRQQSQTDTIDFKSPEEVADIVNNGTKEEQQDQLKQLMAEFTQNAPQYEGIDKGLAIAKIGFAMASGKSPDAIQNIASALEKGADDFIKDKGKRDAFNRQVQLSALQYGLGEIGKEKAEDRLLTRERRGTKSYTFGENGGTYKGRDYGPYADVEVTVADIQDNKMPTGLVSSAMVTALATRAKTNAAILKSQFEAGQISMSELSKQQETYTTSVDNVIKSEQAVDLLEDVMVDVAKGEVTGFKPAALDFFNKVGNFAGFDFGKKYETKDQARSAMKQALQLMIPNTVGSTQSANSISNRDVDFLITAYFGEGAIDGGPFTFIAADESTMLKRLQGAALQMRNAQKKDFATMEQVEINLMSVYQPGTQRSALGSLDPTRRRLSEAGLLPGQLSIGTTIGVTKGDDGVLRFS